MNWLKQFFISCVAVGCFAVSWLVSFGIGSYWWCLRSPWYQILLALAFCGTGFLLTRISQNTLGVIGYGMIVGAVIGMIFPLYEGIIGLFEYADGFWICLLAWLIFTIMLAAAGAICVSGIMITIKSIFKFDFISVLLATAAAIIGAYCAIFVIIGSIQISPFVGIGTLIGITGGAGGFRAESPNLNNHIVMDGYGNMHFVADRMSSHTLETTDGKILRKQADGNWR